MIGETQTSLFGDRLREVRETLGLKQAEAAALVGVTREQWGRYERGIAMPGGQPLAALAAAGADIHYLLTAQSGTLDARELRLMRAYRLVSAEGRAAIDAMAAALAAGVVPPPAPAAVLNTYHGAVGTVHAVHSGTINNTYGSAASKVRQPARKRKGNPP